MEIKTGYIDHIKDEILNNFKYMISMKKEVKNLFFSNIVKVNIILYKKFKIKMYNYFIVFNKIQIELFLVLFYPLFYKNYH